MPKLPPRQLATSRLRLQLNPLRVVSLPSSWHQPETHKAAVKCADFAAFKIKDLIDRCKRQELGERCTASLTSDGCLCPEAHGPLLKDRPLSFKELKDLEGHFRARCHARLAQLTQTKALCGDEAQEPHDGLAHEAYWDGDRGGCRAARVKMRRLSFSALRLRFGMAEEAFSSWAEGPHRPLSLRRILLLEETHARSNLPLKCRGLPL